LITATTGCLMMGAEGTAGLTVWSSILEVKAVPPGTAEPAWVKLVPIPANIGGICRVFSKIKGVWHFYPNSTSCETILHRRL